MAFSSSPCWPTSTIRPRSSTTSRSALRSVLKPMGDGDRRAALDQVVERFLDLALGLGVDRAGGLVEDQDPRVDQQGAGDRNPLPLAARKRLAPLADQRVVAVGQTQDELVGARGAGRGDDLRRAWRRAGRRRCSRRSCRRTGTALAARCRCAGDIRAPGTSGCRRRRPGSPLRPRRRSGRPGSPACSCPPRWGRPGRSSRPGRIDQVQPSTTGRLP